MADLASDQAEHLVADAVDGSFSHAPGFAGVIEADLLGDLADADQVVTLMLVSLLQQSDSVTCLRCHACSFA
ncbi:hypothetical protein [Streptomyces sp. DH10]|uniref:hypothetical protein n=1 Tax=Streptomyces sp. DH10 TaxID=3040121 RepID=UPI003014D7B8